MAEGLPQEEPVLVPSKPAFTVFERAARGDLGAQREMYAQCLAAWCNDDFCQDEVARCAEFWGRLANAHGEQEDAARLLDALVIGIKIAEVNGESDRAAALKAESVAIVDTLADTDTAIGLAAASQLERFVADCSPSVIDLAKQLKGALPC